jgi:hypothetical protein
VEKVCQILEQFVADGTLSGYAIGGATAAGFHGEPLATATEGKSPNGTGSPPSGPSGKRSWICDKGKEAEKQGVVQVHAS